MNTSSTAMYADFQGLANLKSQARVAPGESIDEVAAQFESIFFQMMLKSMRDATIDGGLFNSDQLQMYQEMFDHQLSLDLSQQGGLGLAEILVEQLGGKAALSQEDSQGQPGAALDPTRLDVERQLRSLSTIDRAAAPAGLTVPVAAEPAAVAGGAPAEQWQPQTPAEFVHGVWQHAQQAAGRLGVDPGVLVAQSALETGWGKKVIRAADGSSSNNLFGIKAGPDWQGKTATVGTVEYRDGVASVERAVFRVYDSLAGAFDDYVSFLQDNPRYQGALAAVGDSRAFLQGLQGAGYATDPGYADKITGILQGDSYAALVDELKNSADQSLMLR